MRPKSEFQLLRKVKAVIDDLGLIQPGERVLAAVSGGPDSVALARLLHVLSGTCSFHLAVLHVNHHLRDEESNGDEAFCRQLAADLEVPFLLREAEVLRAREDSGGSLETVARRLRYEAYTDAAGEFQASRIALAHHADDQAETILFRILRGTGLHGLTGMHARRPLGQVPGVEIIRPLLAVSRAEILEYLEAVSQDWRQDLSNFSEAHTRNWIRLHLLPLLEQKLHPGIRANLVRLAGHAEETNRFLEDAARKVYENLVQPAENGGLTVVAESFRALPGALRTALIEMAVREIRGPAQGLLSVHHQAIRKLVTGDDGEVQLPGGIRVSLQSGRLHVVKAIGEEEEFGPCLLPQQGILELPGGLAVQVDRLYASLPTEKEIREAGGRTACLDASKICAPLTIRRPQAGDRFHPFGLEGTQKLQDFLVNTKVPRAERARLFVVTDRARIVWVAGHRTADPVKITRKTESVIRLKLLDAREQGSDSAEERSRTR